MTKLTVILPCAGQGTRLDLSYPKEIHSIEKSKSLIDFVTKSVIKRIKYKYGHSRSRCEIEITYHL